MKDKALEQLMLDFETEKDSIEIPPHLEMPYVMILFNGSAVETPAKWKDYELMARRRILRYMVEDTGRTWWEMLNDFADEFYSTGRLTVFHTFNSRLRRLVLCSDYITWMKLLTHEISEEIKKIPK